MKRLYPFLFLMILVAGISFGALSLLHSKQPLPRPCSFDSLSVYLSLTEEQRKQVQPMFAKLENERPQAVRARDEAVSRLVTILKSDKATNGQVESALRSVDAAQSRVRQMTVRHLVRLKTVLTDEQKEKLFDLVEQRLCVGDHQAMEKRNERM